MFLIENMTNTKNIVFIKAMYTVCSTNSQLFPLCSYVNADS